MKTITDVINEFINYIVTQDDYCGGLEEHISQPLNTNRATEEEVLKTEEKLGCKIPNELRNYYLNDANGTEENEEEYAIFDETLDIFSHQKIINIYDYFKLYWEELQDENVDEVLDDTGALDNEEEALLVKKYTNEFFVCIANWENNFIGTFVFDKVGNFYKFNFDQDEMIDRIIEDLLTADNAKYSVKKDKNLSKLLEDYLDEFKRDL